MMSSELTFQRFHRESRSLMLGFLKSWVPVVLWMGLIFLLSTEVGAAPQTGRILAGLLHFFWPHAPPAVFEQVHFLIRKAAHFTEYAILALLLCRAWYSYGPRSLVHIRWKSALAAGVFALLYAAGDEWHQSFVPGRTATVRDVLLDSLGAGVAAMVWLVLRRRNATAATATAGRAEE